MIRNVFHHLALLFGGVSSQLACHSQNKLTTRPNIILLIADDIDWVDAGFNGKTMIKTPGLNQMASDVVVFDCFYAGSAISSSTQKSRITGHNSFKYGIYFTN